MTVETTLWLRGKNILKKSWIKYRLLVKNATAIPINSEIDAIKNWRNKVFTLFITWLFPVCLIALIPGVYMGIKAGYPIISAVDLLTVIFIFSVTFAKKISVSIKQAVVFIVMYSLSTILLILLGLMGPGFVYLFALTVFISLVFPLKSSLLSVLANLTICVFCSAVIYFGWFNSPLIKEFTVPVWITVSSNLIFLSVVCVLLVNHIIINFENTIVKEFELKSQLQLESVERKNNLSLIKESEGHYKSLFFNGPSPMLVLDNESQRFLQVNEAAIECFGFSAREFLNLTLADIKTESERAKVIDLMPEIDKESFPQIEINQLVRKNGERFFAEVLLSHIPFRGKQATLVFTRDLTDQMKYVSAIEIQNKKLQNITYIQSHLVRAPFARIMGLVELIRLSNEVKPDPEILEYLGQSAKEFDLIIASIVNNSQQTDML